MRFALLAATALAAVALTSPPIMAHEDEALPARTAPLAVSIAPDQLLAPYYEALR